jgi:ribosomal protein S18 acetylase RimI-like enzyme
MQQEALLHDLVIAPAQTSELDAVLQLWSQQDVVLRPEDSVERLQSELAGGSLRLYVARHAGQVIGAILAGQDGNRGYLYHLAVATRARRQGIGEALVDAARRGLLARGINRYHVCVTTDNTTAQAFWASMGWQHRTDLAVYTFCDAHAAHDGAH